MKRLLQALIGKFLIATALVGLVFFACPLISTAQNKAAIRVRETIQIERNGNAKFQIEMKFAIGPYTNLKNKYPNTALLMRHLGLGSQGWQEVRDVNGEWHDGESTVRIRYTTIGMCRTGKDMSWEVPVAEDADLELSAMHENIATLTGAVDSPLGIVTSTTRVILPSEAKDVRLLTSPARLAFRMAAPAGGAKTAVSFSLDAKPQMMSSLSKSHANPKFNHLWVARSRFENTGDQCIRDFRVRFRIVNFTSAWSPWKVCPQVVPGQTVCDAFFPVLDLEKVGQLNGSANVMLEAQYQYKTADGKLVEDSESQQIELLGHNTVFTSSLPEDERVGWYDAMNLGPVILASFVTHEDPIIQQVAGWISGQAGGAASALDTKDALEYLKAINDFLVANEIKYQTAPFNVEKGNAYQHVKYGRDVLRNRAGTCIDLAILWGSLCEAVGLKPVLFLVPGHCFPAVYLPNGELIAIESTLIGRGEFKQAIEVGMKEMAECHDGLKPHFKVDIKALHAQGVKPLEQSTLPVDTLEKWGVKKVTAPKQQSQQPQAQQPASPPRNGGVQSGKLVGGIWVATVNLNNGQKLIEAFSFGDNGTFAMVLKPENGQMTEKKGQYAFDGRLLRFTIDGKNFEAQIEFRDADHLSWIEKDARIEFTRRWPQTGGNQGDNAGAGNNSPPRQSQPKFSMVGGVWRATMVGQNGVKIFQAFTMGADGSFASSFEAETGEKMEVYGTFTYANGVVTLTANGNTESGAITWIDANHIVFSKNGAAKVEYTRTAE